MEHRLDYERRNTARPPQYRDALIELIDSPATVAYLAEQFPGIAAHRLKWAVQSFVERYQPRQARTGELVDAQYRRVLNSICDDIASNRVVPTFSVSRNVHIWGGGMLSVPAAVPGHTERLHGHRMASTVPTRTQRPHRVRFMGNAPVNMRSLD